MASHKFNGTTLSETASVFDPFCLSSFLTFRYVVNPDAEWRAGLRPQWPAPETPESLAVRNAAETLSALHFLVSQAVQREPVGLLLSGGIDSAILAAQLPRGSHAYTIQFDAPNAVNESGAAELYARHCGLRHRTVTVTWRDYERHACDLMRHKKAPLHPVEVGLFVAAQAARADGLATLMVGNGADSTFGGLDQLLSRDWTLDEFIRRYTFLPPETVLCEPMSMRDTYAAFDSPDGFNTAAFLKEVHGRGVIQAFDNSISAAGCRSTEPYESLRLDGPLDMARIRNGESKYLLREIFQQLYPGLPLPEKIAFARPMDAWMHDWTGPQRPEFRGDIELRRLSGEQKWLLYNLEEFLNLFE